MTFERTIENLEIAVQNCVTRKESLERQVRDNRINLRNFENALNAAKAKQLAEEKRDSYRIPRATLTLAFAVYDRAKQVKGMRSGTQQTVSNWNRLRSFIESGELPRYYCEEKPTPVQADYWVINYAFAVVNQDAAAKGEDLRKAVQARYTTVRNVWLEED